jgi:hypothetical protein
LLFSLLLLYPLSKGPAFYAVSRGWLLWDAVDVAFAPADRAIEQLPQAMRDVWTDYQLWWLILGNDRGRSP